MKKAMYSFIGIAVFATLILGFASCGNDSKDGDKAGVKAKTAEQTKTPQKVMAPDFELTDVMNGKKVKLSDYKGKLVFVNFWATWCPPCKAEIPDMIRLQKVYKDKIQFLGISVDSRGSAEEMKKLVKNFVRDNGINYPVMMVEQEVVNAYGNIASIPTTFVIDKDGMALGRIVGARNYEQFEGIVKEFAK